MAKASRQLVSTKVPVAFLFSEEDWCCNPDTHHGYFAWILTSNVGPEIGKKSPTFQVFANKHEHDYLENVLTGTITNADDADAGVFEAMWSSVFGGLSSRMQSIQIE